MSTPAHRGPMPRRPGEPPLDYEGLASYLSALGYATRLQLLDHLRFPAALGDIRVQPRRGAGLGPQRPAARETVRAHLDRLVEVGLVRSELVREEGKQFNRYAVNAPKLYGLVEELRRLSTMYAGRGAAGSDATGTLQEPTPPPAAEGPRLVLVHGAYEGKTFPLTEATAQQGRWTIGRRPGLPVSLDYDPYVSVEHAAITLEGGRYHVLDLKGSKNGTSLNWAPLPKELPRALRAADVIGVGRSLLCLALD